MKEFFNNLLLYFQFFTRIPINKCLKCEKENFRDGAFFFPVVGLFIGSVQWGIYKLLNPIFPATIIAVIVLIVPVILTGGLHQDGLGDTFDGFFCFKGEKEKLLEVMKDSRIGTYACIAIIADMLLRFAAITTIIQSGMTYILIAAPIIGRLSVVYICNIGKPAKKISSANIYIQNIGIKGLILSIIITILFLFKFIEIKYLLILIVGALIVSTLFNMLCNNKIGGLNGDTLGCNYEMVDVFTMLLYIALFIK